MKKSVTLFALLIVATSLFAQKGKVTSALSYKESGDLKKAYEAIEIAIDPANEKSEKSIAWANTWKVRGEILREIYSKGLTDLVDEPLFKAFDSYKKAIELDEKSKYSKSLVIDLTFLQTDFSNHAVSSYQKEDYATALKCFESFMAISNLPIMNKTGGEAIDTAIIYNSGLAAFKAGNWDKAINYFHKSSALDYNGAASYNFAFEAYEAKGDTLGAVNLLKEGFEKYPDDETLIVQLINFYISSGKADDAVNYLDLAIAKNPTNVSYYTAKGGTLEKLGREDDAVGVYKEAIKLDSTQFTPYYNLGVIFYNRGVNVLNEATQLPANAAKEYDEKINVGKTHLKEALPYIEKAYSIDSTEVAIMESLRLIYYRLQMTKKYDEINKKIQSINK